MTSPGAGGFKIADGYVEVHGVVDRRSVIAAADQVTRGVSDQMTTGVAFSNLRDGGRKMGAVLGEHGGPNAAREVTEGLGQWIDQGASAGHVSSAGEKLGNLLGRSSGSPFVEHMLAEIDRAVEARVSAGGGGGSGDADTVGAPGGPGGGGGDGRIGTGRGGAGGRGGDGDSGRGRTGSTGPSGKDAENHGRSLGATMGQAAVGGFLDSFTGGFRGLGTLITANPVVGTAAIALGGGLALLAAPAFAAAFSAALIGGAGLGVIGLGAWLLRDDPKVKAAASKLGNTAKSVFTGAAQPLAGPFERALNIFDQLLKDIAPDLTEMFTAISPSIEPLARGISGFIKEAMPGFLDLIKAATPFLSDLENTLPRFGEHIGKFLSLIADSGPQASLFFRDFIHLIGLLLTWFGYLIVGLSSMYAASRTIILTIVDVFMFFYNQAKWSLEQVIKFFGRLKDFIAGVWRAIKGDTDGFVDFLKKLPGRAWDAVKDAPNRIKKVFSSAFEWLKDAGGKIIGGLIRGIKDAIPGLTGVLDWVTGMIPDWKGPEDKDRKLLEPTGRMIMGGLTSGIKQGADDVRVELAGLTDQLGRRPTPAPAVPGHLTVNIQGVWDFTNGRVPGALVAELYRALNRYEKSYA
jgi:hypothetical protein